MNEYQAIYDYHKETSSAITLLCSILSVSRSGYYKWLNHTPSNHEDENIKLMKRIKTLFYKYKGIFGYRRLTIAINRESRGKQYNH